MKALLVIAKTGFQDKELKGVRDGLISAGFDVTLASTEAGSCTGKFGSMEEAAIAMKDVTVGDFDRIGFIGGPGAGALADNEDAKALARATARARKPLGAICIAPLILAKAGLLQGKKATVWDKDGEQSKIFKDLGIDYTGDAVTIDGSIITGDGPEAAEEFGRLFAKM